MNICDLKFCRCTMAEYKNLDKHNANMLYLVSDGDKILLFIGDDSIQSVLTENILLDAMNDDVTISNFKSGDRMENVLRNALFNIVALSKKEFEVKSDIPEIGNLNNGKYLRISDDGTLIWDVAPKGEKGDKGDAGDTGAMSRMVMVYRSGKSDTEQVLFTPTKPIGGGYDFSTNKVTLPNGWYSSDCDDKGKPLEAPIFMSSRTFSSDENLTEPEWSTPIRITGDDGQAGTDGNSVEFIYYLTNDSDKNNVPIPHNDPEDEYVPKHQGWTDSPRGVDDEYQWEYFALRRKSNNSWSNWSTPALWSKYGVMGQDGDGVQYIYKRTTSSGAPEEELTPSNWENPTSDYQTLPEYVVSGYEWYDNPQGVTEQIPYEWVAVRKFCSKNNGKKMWQPYEPAKLWAKFGEKGSQGEPGQNGALTKFVMLYASGTDENEISGPSGIGYDFVEHKLIIPQDSIWQTDDSGLTPPIFMSSRTFASIPELTDAEWSTPVRITGADGEAGADGDNIEFIYFLTDSDEKKPERPSINDDLTTLELLGWSDNPKGVEETKPYEYFSMRRTSNGNWGEWSTPALWSKYGTNGQDGDGVQYIYINTVDEDNIPDNPTPEDWRQPYSEYQTLKEFKPSNWNDNPKGVSKEDGTEFEWVSMRKFQYDEESGKKMWSKFSDPKIWARLAKDGEQGPQGEKGEKGEKGDAGHLTRLFMLYKGGEIVETPIGGSYNFEDGTFECPDGWKLNDSELERPIWISSRLFSTSDTLQDTEWSTPICITGADGEAGKDGTNVEFIYKLSSNPTLEDSEKPTYTDVDKNVPLGWNPSPQGVKRETPYEFFSMRMKNDGVWGNWSEPAVWSKFGMNGQDGDGVEYIYYRDNTGTQPTLQMPDDYKTNEEYQKNEWRPNDDWKDDPQGVQLDARYEWVSSRKYRYSEELGYKIWHEFSIPSLWAKFGEKGDKGEPGNGSSSKIVMLYASGESVTGLSTECKWDWNENTLVNKPNEWHTSDSQLEPPVWMSSRIFSSDDSLNDVNWSTPVKITGADGKAGRDGNSIEFIYYATDESSVPLDNYPTNVRDDGYVPRDLGWSDEPSGISQSSKYEFFSTRTKNAENEWGDWSTPVLWSKYGTNGQDGDSVQYIYIRTRTEDVPDNPTPDDFLTNDEYQSSSEWIPSEDESLEFQWEDDPQGVTDEVKYEWVSSRKYTFTADGTDKMWYGFSTPTLWAKFGKDGVDGKDGVNGKDGISYRTIMLYKSGYNLDHVDKLGNDMGSYDFTTHTFTISDDTWKMNDSSLLPPVYMSSRTFASIAVLNDESWTEPIRITGADGMAGKDGDSIEFIFFKHNESSIPVANQLDENDDNNTDGYVPTSKGWTNNPNGISEDYKYEFMSRRTKRNDVWGRWSTPTLWSKYGVNGQDGDGIEYVYTTTDSEKDVPTLVTPIDWSTNPEYQQSEYKPLNDYGKPIWTDNPSGVQNVDGQRVEWVSSRRYCALTANESKKWQEFSTPKVWARFSKDGADGAQGPTGPAGPTGATGPKGDTGKLGKVAYPAGKYNQYKVYISTDVKAPYVMIDDDYYLLKETMYWSGGRCYYNASHESNDSTTYKYVSINPEDMNDENSVLAGTGNTINFWCGEYCTNDNFNDKWDANKPNLTKAKSVLVNGKKYIKQYYKSNKNYSTYVGNVVWTLNPEGTEVVLASKFIYSTDGTPENIMNDISKITFGNKTPAEDAVSNNPVWEKFESFEAIYAKIGIIENGTIGSAVYSGDFMFSQQGVDSKGNTSVLYQKFNPEHIYDDESEFKPNICMNFKAGEIHACGGNVNFGNDSLYVKNFLKKIRTTINDDNLGKYTETRYFTNEETGKPDNSSPYKILNIEKTGSFIEWDCSNSETLYLFSLPQLFPGKYSNGIVWEEIDAIRDYIGNEIYIKVNQGSLGIVCYKRINNATNLTEKSIMLAAGESAVLTCKPGLITADNKSYECIYWDINTGKQFEFYYMNHPWEP